MDLEIGIVKIIVLIIQITTLVLLIGLLNIYRKSYKEIKIGYTIGLIIFAFLLIVQNIVQISISLLLSPEIESNTRMMFQYRELLPVSIELIAIAVLYKITKDY